MSYTELKLTNGEVLEVQGDLEETERRIRQASQGGLGLAWFTEKDTDESVAVNVAHIVSLRLAA
jgi:hypothetical protein